MTTRWVVLDADLIAAVADPASPRHADAILLYGTLVDGYVARSDRLFALSTVLSSLAQEMRRGLFAPVETLYVSRRNLADAKKVTAEATPETALTLVVLEREKIHTIATLGHDFDPYALTILHPPSGQ